MAVVTYTEVAVSLGRPITDALEQAQITQWISDAELQIRLRLGDLALLDQEALAYVVREAVILKILNPEGKQSEALDDYNYRRFDANARGQVFITDEWWDLLTPDAATDAFTIRPYGSADPEPDQWTSATEYLP